jgi:hypothetical protein
MLQSDGNIARLWSDYCAVFDSLTNWFSAVADPCSVTLGSGASGKQLKELWEKHRKENHTLAASTHPYTLQGKGKSYTYKLFLELCLSLSAKHSRLGILVPAALYRDFGSYQLRERLIKDQLLEFLYSFQNEKKIFSEAHHDKKQVVVIAGKSPGHRYTSFDALFRLGVADSPYAHEIPDDILSHSQRLMTLTKDDVQLASPGTLSLIEIRKSEDALICNKVYRQYPRLGDHGSGWSLRFAQEINMTSDSQHFPPITEWEERGFKPDKFGRYVGTQGEVALPLRANASNFA